MPSPNQFHSEFGYMCPTPRFRRILRVSFVAGLAGALAGAVGVIALAQRADVGRMRTDIASTVSSTVGMAVTNAAIANLPSTPAIASCTAQNWPFVDKQCLLGTERNIRAAPDTIAAVDPSGAAAAWNEAWSAKQSQPAAAPAKKRPRPVHRREPVRPDAASRNAYLTPMTYDQWRFDNSVTTTVPVAAARASGAAVPGCRPMFCECSRRVAADSRTPRLVTVTCTRGREGGNEDQFRGRPQSKR